MSGQQSFTLAQFARLSGSVYCVVNIDGDTSEYIQVVKRDLVDALRQRGEKGVMLARDGDEWLYLGVLYADG